MPMAFSSYLHNPRIPRFLSRLRRDPRPALSLSVQIIALYHLATTHVGEVGLCTGPSMLPTLAPDAGVLFYVRLPFLSLFQRTLSPNNEPSASARPDHGDDPTALGFTLHSSKALSRRTCGLPLCIGDIVVASSPHSPGKQVCKRVLGLPGDRLLIEPREGQRRKMVHAGTRIFEERAAKPQGSSTSPSTPKARLLAPLPLPVLETSSSGGRDGHDRIPAAGKGTGAGVGAHDSLPGQAEYDEDEEDYFTVPPGHVWLAGDNLQNSTDSRDYGPVPMGCLRGKVVARLYPSPKIFPSAPTPIASDRPQIAGLLNWLPMAPSPSSLHEEGAVR